jgi:hypothetical protein
VPLFRHRKPKSLGGKPSTNPNSISIFIYEYNIRWGEREKGKQTKFRFICPRKFPPQATAGPTHAGRYPHIQTTRFVARRGITRLDGVQKLRHLDTESTIDKLTNLIAGRDHQGEGAGLTQSDIILQDDNGDFAGIRNYWGGIHIQTNSGTGICGEFQNAMVNQ